MNNARMKSIEDQQSGIARKVLDAVPIQECWTHAQICSELRRLGANPDQRIVGGCLGTLIKAGLIREPKLGYFRRVASKPEREAEEYEPSVGFIKQPKSEPIMRAVTNVQSQDTIAKADPLDRMASVAKSFRALSGQLENMAVEVEESALAMQASIEKANAESSKLKQLQDLLKSIGQ